MDITKEGVLLWFGCIPKVDTVRLEARNKGHKSDHRETCWNEVKFLESSIPRTYFCALHQCRGIKVGNHSGIIDIVIVVIVIIIIIFRDVVEIFIAVVGRGIASASKKPRHPEMQC